MSAGLLLVLLLAKAAMLGFPAATPLTAWSFEAYVWQDVLVALAFAAFQAGLKKIGATPRIASAVYWPLVIYAAINIPVERELSTPLTWPMLRAARGPLADSMLIYVTATNTALVLTALAIAAGLPLLMRRVPRRWARMAAVCAIPVVLLGPIARSRVDTLGMDRNAITALIGTELPRVSANTRRGSFAVSEHCQGSQRSNDKPGIHRGRVSFALWRQRRGNAESQHARPACAGIRECLRSISGKHQGAVLSPLLHVSRVR
jgi:hypothetical protein